MSQTDFRDIRKKSAASSQVINFVNIFISFSFIFFVSSIESLETLAQAHCEERPDSRSISRREPLSGLHASRYSISYLEGSSIGLFIRSSFLALQAKNFDHTYV
jgi:hypothetical protein